MDMLTGETKGVARGSQNGKVGSIFQQAAGQASGIQQMFKIIQNQQMVSRPQMDQ